MTSLSKEEREYTIGQTETEDCITVYSSSPKFTALCRKLAEEVGAQVLERGPGVTFKFPQDCVRIALKKRRKLNAAQAQAAAEKLAKARATKAATVEAR